MTQKQCSRCGEWKSREEFNKDRSKSDGLRSQCGTCRIGHGPRDPYSELQKRFWSRVDKSDDCWLWQAALDRCGYGRFSEGQFHRQAHRVAWKLVNGEIPEGFHVLHRCDNRQCVNPAHLFLGTRYDKVSLEERFWSKVDKSGDCWLWKARLNKSGYGTFSEKPFCWLAHRLAWKLVNGEIPEGLNVLHKCDNPQCVNPDHLFLGTHYDNVRDMIKKGRQRYVAKWGEENGRAKLVAEQVSEIRQRYDNGETQTILARAFDVDWVTINRIVKGISWRL